MTEQETILRINGISKRFGGVEALTDVSFEVRKGEIHALMGENGAGKSTLVKILSGVYVKDTGHVFFEGKELHLRNTQHARELGINSMYQELSLVPSLTVAENICASNSKMNTLKAMNIYNLSQDVLDILNRFKINPFSLVKDLGIGAQQMTEIAGAISRQCKLLILDEPTAALTLEETEELFKILQILKEHGVTIIYISHKIAEVFQIAERITVLKDGFFVGTITKAEASEKKIISMMIGRDLKDMYPPKTLTQQECILEASNISGEGFDDISFKLHRGEILGFAGLSGAGRTELFTSIFGYLPIESGEIVLKGKKATCKSPKKAMSMGIGYLPEDRKSVGLFMPMNIKDNTIAADLDQMLTRRFLSRKKILNATVKMIQDVNIKVGSLDDKILSLSGGNQQKVILSRWLLMNPAILIADEPTRGIDVGAKYEIYQILRKLADGGMGIILISSELPEIIGMCDRVIAMYQGRIFGEAAGNDPKLEETIGHAIVGIKCAV